MLEPDKVALAILYLMHADDDSDLGDPDSIAQALGNIIPVGQVRAQIDRLFSLGLVVGMGPTPMNIGGVSIGGTEWWSITHDGSKYVHKLLRQPKSFVARIHNEGVQWLSKNEAQKSKLSTKLTSVDVYGFLEESEEKPRRFLSISDWSRSEILAAMGIFVAIIIGVITIA